MRNTVRILTGAALCTAVATCVTVSVPEKLPAVAIQQPGLYRLEVALLVFYGALLLITPAFSGLSGGRLPTEISTRGAKFTEGADQWTERDEAATRELEKETADLVQAVAAMQIAISRLSEKASSDSSQQGVDSDRD